MREIKFRAWCPERKSMSPIVTVDSIFKNVSYNLDVLKKHGMNGKNIDNIVWMQFTGMHDKNGKEIYEGDILREISEWRNNPCAQVKFYNDSNIISSCGCCNALFSGSGFACFPDDKEGDGISLGDGAEIIGNIYENPELLASLKNK